MKDQVNILMVDDQPAKLLSYETILDELGENLIKANSAKEALEQLLKNDIAVVLMDVSMPDLSGFELADMIRQHPRFQRTAIIFISAVHLTKSDIVQGYQRGAVDYISVPVIPDLLKAKVTVFAELHRKTRALEALNSELERRVQERTEELQDSETQFRTLANSIPQLVWMAHADGYIFWYNERWYTYTGTTPEQMEGWGWQRVHDPAALPNVLERWNASIKNGQAFEMIFPLRGADGIFRLFLTRIFPSCDGKGKVLRWFGTNTDVDELKRTQDALRESEHRSRLNQERLRLTQRVARIASWEVDIDTETYTWSKEALEILGRQELGHTKSDLLSLMYYSADREAVQHALKTITTRNKEFETQFRVMWPNGQARWIAARGVSFYNQGKGLVVGVFIDITDAEKVIAPRKQRSESLVETSKGAKVRRR
ncbi:MAG: PAS domain-containing protein [Acidobacteria bacterium]|nr:PAS domain-containing protein [Acidobacteriota bacterium]